MSLWKVIVIVSICTVLLFIGMLVYALYPTIRDVSDHPQLRAVTGHMLDLKKDTYVYIMEAGQYRFEPLLLSTDGNYPYEKKLVLPAGSAITIEKFKTYRSDGGSGLTELYGIGTATTATGKKIRFEYDWGHIVSNSALKLAPWQDTGDRPVFLP
jgi:hypothetical protein